MEQFHFHNCHQLMILSNTNTKLPVMHVTTAYNEETQSIQCIMENSVILRSMRVSLMALLYSLMQRNLAMVPQRNLTISFLSLRTWNTSRLAVKATSVYTEPRDTRNSKQWVIQHSKA